MIDCLPKKHLVHIRFQVIICVHKAHILPGSRRKPHGLGFANALFLLMNHASIAIADCDTLQDFSCAVIAAVVDEDDLYILAILPPILYTAPASWASLVNILSPKP